MYIYIYIYIYINSYMKMTGRRLKTTGFADIAFQVCTEVTILCYLFNIA